MTRLADHASRSAPASTMTQRLNITVLTGGPSSEREVSLKSGQAVAKALRGLGHEVTTSDVTPENLQALDIPADLVFVALHGAFGEDGRIQRLLDQRGLRYTGSGAEASALAMDKVASKCRFVEAEVPTPRFDVVTPERVEKAAAMWPVPAVIKPVGEGSSIDIRIVRTRAELAASLAELTARYGRCLLEQYVVGPELTVGILGEEALPVIEIRTKRAFYDYQAKYVDDDTQYLFDVALPPAVLAEVQRLSLAAHRSLGCRHFSRVDWMVDTVTHQPYALEINTIPGFTDHSLLPKAAARAGMSFAQMCRRILELAEGR